MCLWGGGTDTQEDREVWCVRLNLGNVSQDSWVAFLSPRLQDSGKGSSAEPSIMWGLCTPRRKRPSSSLLITSPRETPHHPSPLRLSRPGRSSPGLGSFRRWVPREHLGWRGPAFLRHSPPPAPQECATFILYFASDQDWGILKHRGTGTLGFGLDWGRRAGCVCVETWAYVFRGNAKPPHPCRHLNWFLLICLWPVWIVINWLISGASEGTVFNCSGEPGAVPLPLARGEPCVS